MADSFDTAAILDSFIAEVRSYLPRIVRNLEVLLNDPTKEELREESFRCAHTIKSSSGMMGYPKISELARPLEELLGEVRQGQASVTQKMLDLVQRSLDRVDLMLGGLQGASVDENQLLRDNEMDHAQFRQASVVAAAASPAPNIMPDDLSPDGPALESLDLEWAGEPEAILESGGPVGQALETDEGADPQMSGWLSSIAPDALKVTEYADLLWPKPASTTLSSPEEVLERLRGTISDLCDRIDGLDSEVGQLADDRTSLQQCLTAVEQHLSQLTQFTPRVGAGALLTDIRYGRLFALVMRIKEALAPLQTLFEGIDRRQSSIETIAGNLRDSAMDLDAVLVALSQPDFFVAHRPDDIDQDPGGGSIEASAVSQEEELEDFPEEQPGVVPAGFPEFMDQQEVAAAVGEGADGRASQADHAEQLAQMRAQIEAEVRQSILQELAEEQHQSEELEAGRLASLEEQLRVELRGEIRAELEAEYASRSLEHPSDDQAFTTGFSSLKGVTSAPPEAVQSVLRDDDLLNEEFAAEMAETFLVEADEHMQNINVDLALLDSDSENSEAVRSLRRSVHTLKGAAAMVGVTGVSELAHTLEDLLDRVNEGSLAITAEIHRLIFDASSALETMINDFAAGKKEDRSAITSLRPRFAEVLGVPLDEASAMGDAIQDLGPEPPGETADVVERGEIDDGSEESDEGTPAHALGAVSSNDERGPAAATNAALPGVRGSSLTVRVGMDRLDEFVNLVGELAIIRTTFEQRVENLVVNLEELGLSTQRMRRVARDLEARYEVRALQPLETTVSREPRAKRRRTAREDSGPEPTLGPKGETSVQSGFDELEFDRYTEFNQLTRELAETTADVNSISMEMQGLINELETVFVRQGRLSTDLQDKLMKVRRVPLGNLVPRLYRTLRGIALKQGKHVDLVLEGEITEVDRTVFEEIADPLLHLIRNAVDHGIETPEKRLAAGKSEVGQVRFAAQQEGNEVLLTVADDGAGIDVDKVRAVAVERGVLGEGEELSEDDLLDLIFAPGLSTTDEVTEVSGRGVGLDVVRNNVSRLKGTVGVASTPGQGTTFTIRLPQTLVITKALLVSAGGQVFAIPLTLVKYIGRVARQTFIKVGGDNAITVGEEVYTVRTLAELIGENPDGSEEAERPIVLIVGVSGRMVALTVDDVLAEQDVVVKSLGQHLRVVKGVSGATILGNGQVVLILNLPDLLVERAAPVVPARIGMPAAKTQAAYVLVVDDSLSVRRVLSNVLRKAGWVARTARDGVEALEMVQNEMPTVMVVDIEMPRMDGFELLSVLRDQPAFRGIPIAVLTSRSGQKHRQKALELGADSYIVKPFQEEELLRIVGELASRQHNVTA